ncbi:MAG: DUF695 domain-containing protein [Chitinophagaceae bacterium]|nr:DUF695 domain-containing protein [Chitinophagaceae bacterium]
MSFLKKLFSKEQPVIDSNAAFWAWFRENEKTFFKVLKNKGDVENDFFAKMSDQLDQLREGYYFVAGMQDENTAELIVTADGNLKNIAFVEALIAEAPSLPNWKLTALKPELDIENVEIAMSGLRYNKNNIFFYSNIDENYPDEIDLTFVHSDMTEENKEAISNGIYVFLDNYLGELSLMEDIDSLEFTTPQNATEELIPIEKLKGFLTWRKKEFIEKYEGIRYNTDNDTYSVLEAETPDGTPMMAALNSELLEWDSKASHPWMTVLTFNYDGSEGNGMPTDTDYQLLNTIEDAFMVSLKDEDGYLNLGRETGQNQRKVYFACKDFRKPSIHFDAIEKQYPQYKVEFSLYKDKYWRTMERFA